MAEPRFTALLNLYRREEDDARRTLGAHERERLALLEREAEIECRRRQAAASVALPLRQQLTSFWAQTGIELQAVLMAITACDAAISAARESLFAAHRRVSTFIKLQERDAQASNRRQERRDARRLDELAALRVIVTHPGQEASA